MSFYEDIVKITEQSREKRFKKDTKKLLKIQKKKISKVAKEGKDYVIYLLYDETWAKFGEVETYFNKQGFKCECRESYDYNTDQRIHVSWAKENQS